MSLRRLLRLFFLVFVLAEAYGIGMEYVQKYFIPMRDYDQADIIADLIGAGLAYGLSTIWLVPRDEEKAEKNKPL
jgi:VanZ family protein